MASLRCLHDNCSRSTYCYLLCFLRAPFLILILSIRRVLFSGSKAERGLRNNIHMFFYIHNDQDQLLLPRNGPSNLILDCVANWKSLSRTLELYYASTFLFGQSVAPSFFHTILQFYNFRTISLWSLQTLALFVCLFVCLFHFVFSWLTDFTKHFINIIFNEGTVKSATTNACFADIGVPVANLWGQ